MTSFSFNTAIPANPNNPSNDQPDMLQNNVATDGILAVNHISFNALNGGQHTRIDFNVDPGFPYTPPGPPFNPSLFVKNPAGGPATPPELFYYAGTAAQTSGQYTSASNGSTMLLGGIIIKWFTITALVNTNDYLLSSYGLADFPNNGFAAWGQQITGNSDSVFIIQSLNSSMITARKISGNGNYFIFMIGN